MSPPNHTSVSVRPRVFVGSSNDGIKVARIIKESLERFADVKLWEKDVFRPGEVTIEVLLREAAVADFAVLVATPDRAKSPASAEPSANIIFEMGVFNLSSG